PRPTPGQPTPRSSEGREGCPPWVAQSPEFQVAGSLAQIARASPANDECRSVLVSIALACGLTYRRHMDDVTPCPTCQKPPALCVCAEIVPIDNRIELLILQHPQEQDVELGTAR